MNASTVASGVATQRLSMQLRPAPHSPLVVHVPLGAEPEQAKTKRKKKARVLVRTCSHMIVELVTVMGVSSCPEICGYVGYQLPPVLSVIVD